MGQNSGDKDPVKKKKVELIGVGVRVLCVTRMYTGLTNLAAALEQGSNQSRAGMQMHVSCDAGNDQNSLPIKMGGNHAPRLYVLVFSRMK
jgi:hypothetical protein